MRVDAKTSIYGIIGKPVTHSLSPAMHNAAFNKTGINAVYLAFETDSVEKVCDAIRTLGIRGLSVTIPNKESIIGFLDSVDETAKAIGAVNTVKNEDKRLTGINTDWIGAITAIKSVIEIKNKEVCVIGAGGSARAIVYGLVREGAKVNIFNRTIERAQLLAKYFGCSYSSLEALPKATGDILINTTSIGMKPKEKQTPVLKKHLKNFSVVMDIVYSPLETVLLKDAKSLGIKTVSGLDMLLFQAVGQFEFWTGRKAPVETMKEALRYAANG